jgi:hypothetical protein
LIKTNNHDILQEIQLERNKFQIPPQLIKVKAHLPSRNNTQNQILTNLNSIADIKAKEALHFDTITDINYFINQPPTSLYITMTLEKPYTPANSLKTDPIGTY